MKNKKTKWNCECCGYTETNYKHMDGCICPKCGSWLWFGKLVKEYA
ncbi:MAG: hypothetical protein GX963_16010 [Bacteroidales bacterium]|nr:hypothetical protein [Bacteroidales bacterium]